MKNPGYNNPLVSKKKKTLIKLVKVKDCKNIFGLLIKLEKIPKLSFTLPFHVRIYP